MKTSLVFLAALIGVGMAMPGYECDADFIGFGMEPTHKCDCCPRPCCCKCIEIKVPPPPCSSFLDVSFLLDSSGSIGPSDWEVVKQFVIDVVGSLDSVGIDQFVSMTRFATNATLDWNLDGEQTTSLAALQAAIRGLPLMGSFTNTVEGMEMIVAKVFGSDGDDPNRPNVVVVITDGRSNFHPLVLPYMIKRLQAGATVIVVGVTSQIDMDELNAIAGDPSRVFTVNDFKALTSILTQLQWKICGPIPNPEKCFCCCTPEQFFGGGGAYYYR